MEAQKCGFNFEEQLAATLRLLSIKFGEPMSVIREFDDETSSLMTEEEKFDQVVGDEPPEKLPVNTQAKPRVRFDETANNVTFGMVSPKCEDFMEQTISVPEIEKIFDIDFEKDWVKLVSSYRFSTNVKPWTAEQSLLRKKIQKAEKLLRKRDEKIRLLMQKAETETEAELIRRHVMERMRIKAERYMVKRKRQWQKNELKEQIRKEAELAKMAKLDRGDQ